MRFDPSLRHRLRLSSIYFVCEFEANRSSRSPTIAILPKVVFALERQGFESSAGLLFVLSFEFQSAITQLPVGRFR